MLVGGFSPTGGEPLLLPTVLRDFGVPWEGLWVGLAAPGLRSEVEDGAERVLIRGLALPLAGSVQERTQCKHACSTL